ncbi:MAG: DUF2088 domain-containing protein [Phycisphaerales bacterium]|nr:MAG: DUF2088 domain-containing protein [Phycisphaerales bacterium]
MKVDIHYGRGLMSLRIPRGRIQGIIRPWQDDSQEDNLTVVRRAITERATNSFQDLVAGKRLCLLLDDGTRDEPFEDILGPLLSLLQSSSLVRVLICTGTHNPETPENTMICEFAETAAQRAGISNLEIHAHDCEQDGFVQAGRTARGTEILYNSLTDDIDVFLVVSDVKVHYFAGYSNPIKNFVPGICAYRTAEQNHSLALDEDSTFGVHPWHSDRNGRANPVAEDQFEGMRLIVKDRPVYALVTISAERKIHWARFGPVEEVTGEAFDVTDRKNTHSVRPVERLIVSPGGFPNDASLYIAQRALELTKNAVTDGGEVLFLSACPNGIGEKRTVENFYNRLTAPVGELLESIKSQYKLYSHKPYKFAQMIKRLRRIWVYSEMPDHLLDAAHLYPTHDPQSVVNGWLAERAGANITIVDGANKIALYPAGG